MKLIIAVLLMTIGVMTAQNAAAIDLSPIVGLGDYSKLLEALSATSADSVIAENVPVTILGPTDDAFALVSPLIDDLTNEELKQILLNHVIVGKNYTSKNLENEGGCVMVETAGGTTVSLFIDPTRGAMDVDSIFVVDKDVIGDFGVFLGIEQVILPDVHAALVCPVPAPPADLSAIEALGNYNTFLNAVNQTGLGPIISEYVATILAPTDEALAAVDLSGLSNDDLTEILKNHLVFTEELFSFEVAGTGCKEATSIGGGKIAIRYDEATGVYSVNGISLSADVDVSVDALVLMHGLNGVLTDESQYVSCVDFSPIADAGKYSLFLDALNQTKVNEEIGELVPVTIFGPTDTALAAIQDSIGSLTADELTEVLKNHVVYAEIDSQRIIIEGCIDELTVGGKKVSIRYDSDTDTTTVNGIPIVEADIVSNTFGVFHGIDGLLMDGLSTYTPCLDFSPILEAGNYSTFVSAMGETAEPALINLFKPVTILAPTDSALAAIDPSLVTPELISNHVLYNGEMSAADLISAGCVNIQSGDMYLDFRYNSETGKGTVNGLPIVSYDTEGAFGVMHGLGGVLIKDETPFTPCFDFSPIEKAGNYGTFLSVLNQTEQTYYISSLAPVTFFGPTDSALAEVQDLIAGSTEDELISALDSHILTFPSNLTLEDVKQVGCIDAFTYGTLVFQVSIVYDETTDTMTANGIPVVESIFGDYGVMHGISGVIGIDGEYEPCPFLPDDDPFPPDGPTFDILDELAEAFEQPFIDAMLAAGETTVTVFGPTDEAFSQLDRPETESEILQIFKGHIVAGTVKSEQLKAEGCVILDTLAGTKIRVMVSGETIMINDAKVVLADQMLDGWVTLHGIDKVILPIPGSFEECPAVPTTPPAPAPTTPPTSLIASGGFTAGLGVSFGCMIALMTL